MAGRIRLRGPGVTRSFADGASAPAGDETLVGGWYYPGDIGSLAADGILHLTGRTADMIKRGGLIVHAQEVEYVLSLVDALVEAAVAGVPAGANGSAADVVGVPDEEVVAFVVVGARVEPTALTGHFVQNLAAYKVRRHIEIVLSLPRNTMGKVVKSELRARFAERVR